MLTTGSDQRLSWTLKPKGCDLYAFSARAFRSREEIGKPLDPLGLFERFGKLLRCRLDRNAADCYPRTPMD